MRQARAILLLLVASLMSLAAPARAQTSQEAVKATFVYRFASFVTWPPGALGAAGAPIRMCVIGAEPFARTLARTVAGQRVNGRGFDVRTPSEISAASQCQIVYVAGARVEATLRALRDQPVLTITDAAYGDRDRGIIHFVVVGAHVRFHIDDASASDSRLRIDPRLLSLALSVRRRVA